MEIKHWKLNVEIKNGNKANSSSSHRQALAPIQGLIPKSVHQECLSSSWHWPVRSKRHREGDRGKDLCRNNPGIDVENILNAPKAAPSKAEGLLGDGESGTDRTDNSIDHCRVVAKEKPA